MDIDGVVCSGVMLARLDMWLEVCLMVSWDCRIDLYLPVGNCDLRGRRRQHRLRSALVKMMLSLLL